MSTRKPRHAGNRSRGWEELNRTHGECGWMESEAWYRALRSEDADEAKNVLKAHFGSLRAAKSAYMSLDEAVAKRFQEVADLCLTRGDAEL